MKKILFADDDKNLGDLLQSAMEDAGYSVTLVRDGVEAVLKAIDSKFDIAILDIMMPNLNGINAVRILKKINAGMPILTFSGVAGTGDMAASLKAGALRCLTKPLSVEQLITEIKRALHE